MTSITSSLRANLLLLTSACLLFAGCGSSAPASGGGSGVTNPPPPGNFAGLPFTGKVMAGTYPLKNSSVQLYAAGTTGNGSAPTQLLSNAITTAADGSFSVTANYNCPTATSVLYVVARGGAFTTGANVADVVLLSTLGTCESITGTPSFTVNELTTVVSAYAMAPFMSAGATIGASATNNIGITNAAATVASLVDLRHGLMPSPNLPANATLPFARFYALANMLNACILPPGTTCTPMYQATTIGTTTPANTLDAVLNIARYPGNSVAAIFTLTTPSQAYAGATGAAPTDWTMFVTYTGGGLNDPTAVALDSKGNVWVSNYNGVASLFSNTGVPIFAGGLTNNGLDESWSVAIDTSDNAWITNEASNGGIGSVTKLTASGGASSSSIYTQGDINFPVATRVDAIGTVWVLNYGDSHIVQLNDMGTPLSGTMGIASGMVGTPVAVAFNSKGDAFIANQLLDSVAQVSANGNLVASFTCCDKPTAVAIDQSDNVWVANASSNSIAQINATGQVVSSGYTAGGIEAPSGVAIDGGGNVWVSNYFGNAIAELAGSQSSTPGGRLSPLTGYGADAKIGSTYGLAIDSSGSLWLGSRTTNVLTEFIGIAAPVKTPLIGAIAAP